MVRLLLFTKYWSWWR